MISFAVPSGQSFTIDDYLALWGRGVAGRMKVLPYNELFRRDRLSAGTYVFSALDQLPRPSLELVGQIWDELEKTERVRLLNHPRRALRRYDLLRTLYEKGRNRFRVARAGERPTPCSFPVFLREENGHTGSLSDLIESQAELDGALGRALLDGHRLSDLLVVEYYDTSDAKGMFRKYSAFVVGKEVIARSLTFSRNWVAKAATSDIDAGMVLEEREYVIQNPHQAKLKEIFDIAHIDYGRIDYSVVGEDLQTWEINLNPTIGRGLRPSSGRIPECLRPLREPAKEHFYQKFQAAFEGVDCPSDSGQPIVITACTEAKGRLRAEARRRRRVKLARALLDSIKWLLKPLKPVLQPAVGTVSPFLARLRLWFG